MLHVLYYSKFYYLANYFNINTNVYVSIHLVDIEIEKYVKTICIKLKKIIDNNFAKRGKLRILQLKI